MATNQKGRQPSPSPQAKQRTVMIRMDGNTHARLCELRAARGKSINKLILDAIAKELPLPIVAGPQATENAVASNHN